MVAAVRDAELLVDQTQAGGRTATLSGDGPCQQ
jgi:hypothetical protein